MTVSARPLLLIEDTPSLQLVYRSVLDSAGHNVEVADTAQAGLSAFHRLRPDVVLLDLTLPDRDGMHLMREMLAERPATRIIVITAVAAFERVIEAMRAGAQDFLVKPFDEGHFLDAVHNALRAREAAAQALSQPAASARGIAGLPSSTPTLRRIAATVRAVAYTMAPVFITGEVGTGKSLCARAVHEQSPRHASPFVRIDCAKIPREQLEVRLFGHVRGAFLGADDDGPGAIVEADGGTLFLENVDAIDLSLQPRLLRFLQSSSVAPVGTARMRRVDVRIICSTTLPIEDPALSQRMSPDLLLRLKVMPIQMPALRSYGEDIADLAELQLRRSTAELGKGFTELSAELKALLPTLPWSRNLRQLRDVIHAAVRDNEGTLLDVGMLTLDEPAGLHGVLANEAPGLAELLSGKTLAEIERIVIEAAIERHAGSLPRAAKELGVAPSTLYRKREGWPH